MDKSSNKKTNLQISELLKIIEGGLQNDPTKVLNYSLLLIQKLENNNEVNAAHKIKNVLKRTKSLTLNSKGLPLESLSMPVDMESRLPLAEVRQYREDEIFVSFNDHIMADLEEFTFLLKKQGEISDENIKIYRNLLLCGPPGTGKTQAAKYLSAKASLPLVTVRIDGLVSSYLGNTSKNIRSLFDFIEKTPCILFLDEFDAIAKMRDDSNELGELKRVVNSLLQNIDSLQNKVPMIAATNHQHLLDPAVWRRFDYKIFVGFPKEQEREQIIRKFLGEDILKNNQYRLLSALSEGMSGADIEILCNMIRTKIFIEPTTEINEKNLLKLTLKYKERVSHSNKIENPLLEDAKIVFMKELRSKNKSLFTYDTLSKMFGISTGKISNILNSEVEDHG